MRFVCLFAVLVLAACAEPGPPAAPPEGWVAEGDRWYVPGTDTEAAFRDLESVEAMGVLREDEPEFVQWFQTKMDELYRTNPEVVDSVFGAEFLPAVREGIPAGDDYETAAQGLVRRVQTDFYQRYNPAQYSPPAEPVVIPDSLADVDGQVVLQVYVNRDKEPVAVKVVEGTGTALDQIAMRRAIDSAFTDAWVRETAGQSAGVNVPNWVRVTSTFGG
jgi:hypothetical protein